MSSESITDPLIKIHQECVKKLIPFILCIKSIQLPSQTGNQEKTNSQMSNDKQTIDSENESRVTSIMKMKRYESFEQDFRDVFSQNPPGYFVYGGITSNDPTSDDNIERIFKFYMSLFDASLKISDALVYVSKSDSFIIAPPDLSKDIQSDDISSVLTKLGEKIKSAYSHIGGKRIKKHKRTVKSNKRVTKRRPRRKSSTIKHRRRRTSRK